MQVAKREAEERVRRSEEREEEMRVGADKAIQEKIQFKIQSDEKRERVEILSEENKSLRLKVQDIDDDNRRLKKQMKQLQAIID